MSSKLKNNSNEPYSLGEALLYLRGATKNLKGAIKFGNHELILKRRQELSQTLTKIEDISDYRKAHKDSIVACLLLHNLEVAIEDASPMLFAASSRLSRSLSLV